MVEWMNPEIRISFALLALCWHGTSAMQYNCFGNFFICSKFSSLSAVAAATTVAAAGSRTGKYFQFLRTWSLLHLNPIPNRLNGFKFVTFSIYILYQVFQEQCHIHSHCTASHPHKLAPHICDCAHVSVRDASLKPTASYHSFSLSRHAPSASPRWSHGISSTQLSQTKKSKFLHEIAKNGVSFCGASTRWHTRHTFKINVLTETIPQWASIRRNWYTHSHTRTQSRAPRADVRTALGGKRKLGRRHTDRQRANGPVRAFALSHTRRCADTVLHAFVGRAAETTECMGYVNTEQECVRATVNAAYRRYKVSLLTRTVVILCVLIKAIGYGFHYESDRQFAQSRKIKIEIVVCARGPVRMQSARNI